MRTRSSAPTPPTPRLKLANERGYKIVTDIKYRSNSPSLSAEVQQLKAANADVLMPSSYTTDGILLVKTMAELGYKPNAIVAQDAGFSEKALYDAVGDKLEGVITRGSFSLDLAAKRPMVGKINALFKEKSGKDLNDNTSRQFMALVVMADAINRAKSTDGEKIREALVATDIPGEQTIMPWKRVKFDEMGQNNDADPVLLQYIGGKFVTISPPQARRRRGRLADEVRTTRGRGDMTNETSLPANARTAYARSVATKQSVFLSLRRDGLLRCARRDDVRWGSMPVTAETIIQSLASGLLMGLLYGLIAVGLALIFGLMDVVNFAHGEFLMIAMYATFFLFAFFAIDPLLSAPLVAAALFVFGAVVYLLIVRFAVRAKANAGMVQIFSTFGLAIVMRGLAQYFFTPDYRSVTHSWLGGKTVSVGRHLPARSRNWSARWWRSRPSARSISSSTAPISAARSRRPARMPARWRWSASTRTGCSRWAGASARRWSGLSGAIMAIFFYIYPDVGASFALIAYVTVALGGFGSVFGAFAGGIIVGLVEATTALLLPPSLKAVGIYAVYLLVVFVRPRGLFGSM